MSHTSETVPLSDGAKQAAPRWNPDRSPVRLILCGDTRGAHASLEASLRDAGYSVVPAPTELEVRTALAAERAPVVVIADGDGSGGLCLLRGIISHAPHALAVLVASEGSIGHAVETIKAGAYDYVGRSAGLSDLLPVLHRAAERARRAPETRCDGLATMVGVSIAWRHLIDVARRAASTNAAVLLRGEAGSGKRSLAQAIHASSTRADGPFVAVNGSGDGESAPGIAGGVLSAAGGTLYVNEAAALPPPQQERLLQLLRDGTVDGEHGAVSCDVRVIASTGQNLMGLAGQGLFLEALYYRLSVIPIDLPPLRARTEDLPPLARHFLAASAERHGRAGLVLPDEVLSCLLAYDWPGNVAELETLVERLAVLAKQPAVAVEDLPSELRRDRPVLDLLHLELPEQGISLDGVERELIQRALERYRGNQTQAARYLGISRKTLIYRMEKHGLRRG